MSIQVRLPADLHEQVVKLAQDEDRSLNGEFIHIVRLGLAAKAKQPPAS